MDGPAGVSIQPAQTGTSSDVTTTACGPACRAMTVPATGWPSSHAFAPEGSRLSEIDASAGWAPDEDSPTPVTRPPSSASARAQARSAASRSSGGMTRNREDLARSTSAMSHAACGSSGCARSSASAEASARSDASASRAAIASRTRSSKPSTASARPGSTASAGRLSFDGGARTSPCARAHVAMACAREASGGSVSSQTSVAGASATVTPGALPARRSPCPRGRPPSRRPTSGRPSRPGRRGTSTG